MCTRIIIIISILLCEREATELLKNIAVNQYRSMIMGNIVKSVNQLVRSRRRAKWSGVNMLQKITAEVDGG